MTLLHLLELTPSITLTPRVSGSADSPAQGKNEAIGMRPRVALADPARAPSRMQNQYPVTPGLGKLQHERTKRHVIANVLIGCLTMVVCIVLQTLVVALVLRYLRRKAATRKLQASFWGASRTLAEAMMILMLGHLLQIAVWACLFMQLDEFSEFQTAYYHSTVNFSTLGYGDIVMSAHRRLLGGLEAANGVLMFGLTTSTLYAVINALTGQVVDNTPP